MAARDAVRASARAPVVRWSRRSRARWAVRPRAWHAFDPTWPPAMPCAPALASGVRT